MTNKAPSSCELNWQHASDKTMVNVVALWLLWCPCPWRYLYGRLWARSPNGCQESLLCKVVGSARNDSGGVSPSWSSKCFRCAGVALGMLVTLLVYKWPSMDHVPFLKQQCLLHKFLYGISPGACPQVPFPQRVRVHLGAWKGEVPRLPGRSPSSFLFHCLFPL